MSIRYPVRLAAGIVLLTVLGVAVEFANSDTPLHEINFFHGYVLIFLGLYFVVAFLCDWNIFMLGGLQLNRDKPEHRNSHIFMFVFGIVIYLYGVYQLMQK